MPQKRLKKVLKGRPRAIYPKGWPGNLKAVLYLNSRRDGLNWGTIGQPLKADTMIYGTTEMSNYG